MIWLLGGNLLVRSAGFGYPFLAYHVAGRGHGAGAVGAVVAAYGLGWAVGQLLCGWLVDRVGARVTLVSTMLVAAAVLVLMAGLHTVPGLLVGAMIAGLVCDAPRPVLGAVIAELVADPQRRAQLDGWRYGWVLNIGAAITGGVGGVVAGWLDTPVLYWINGIGCAIFAGLAGRCIPADVCRRTESGLRACTAMSKVGYRQALSDKRLVLLAVSGLATLTTLMGFFAAVPMLMSAEWTGCRGVRLGAVDQRPSGCRGDPAVDAVAEQAARIWSTARHSGRRGSVGDSLYGGCRARPHHGRFQCGRGCLLAGRDCLVRGCRRHRAPDRPSRARWALPRDLVDGRRGVVGGRAYPGCFQPG